ncbi:MAG TPA: hypothetical protein VI299_24680 [Polyangiales bacterium]
MERERLVRMLRPLAELTERLGPNAKRALVAVAVMVPVGLYVGLRTSCVGATPPDAAPAAPVVATEPVLADAGGPPVQVEPVKTTATVTFTVSPNVMATVTWGKKRLGIIKPGAPLYVVRPRDSGPLDVIVKADGYLPVQTRAYTFNDQKMLVKLTKPEESNTLLGYRVPIEAGIPVGLEGDAGAPIAPVVPAAPVAPIAPVAPAFP